MNQMSTQLARVARRVLGAAKARATAADRAHALSLLLSADAQPYAPRPRDGLSVVEMVRFHLASPTFEHHMVSAAMSHRKGALAESVGRAELAWARKRLPLRPATRDRFASETLTRGDVLTALFSDIDFLEAVHAARPWGWSASVFLPPAQPGAETLRFMRALLADKSALISRRTLERWGLDARDTAEALYRFGAIEGFRSNDLFDAAYYRRSRSEKPGNYFDDLRHYVEEGEALGDGPNPFLNMALYARSHPDIVGEVRNGRLSCALEHLLERDDAERRSCVVHFDDGYYGSQTSRERTRGYAGRFAHYVNEGWREGLEPNPCFDQLWYLRTYPEALKAVRDGRYPNAFSHFVMEGEAAGLKPHAFFDPQAYADANPDIANTETLTPFRHFWQQGRFEARDFGLPGAGPMARHFYRRWPDARDLTTGGDLGRLAGDPDTVLQAAKSAAPTADLITDLSAGRRPFPAPRALAQALKALGRPRVNVEVGRDQQVHLGDRARFYLSGLATFGPLTLRSIRIKSEALDAQCAVFRYFRLEEADANALFGSGVDDLKAGFMAWFDFPSAGLKAGVHYLEAAFTFGDDSDPAAFVTHETLKVDVFARPRVSESRAKVQVAMASYNPPARPFAAQVDTILANAGAHLLISDDASPAAGARVLSAYADRPRIDLDVSARNMGFISNFERSLYMRSPAAEVLLFADQDDLWRDDKIRTLRGLLKEGVACAFSDMRVVKDDGEVISPTFWQGRKVHHEDPLSLGVANTVTGAAAAFPVWLAEVMTPFPRYMGVYHDQWLSVLAAAAGRIAYTPKPLYDYVQHGANVLGFSGSRSGGEAHWRAIAKRLRHAARRRVAEPRDLAFVDTALAATIPLLQRFVLLNEALIRVPRWRDPDVQALALALRDAIAGRPYDARSLLRGWRRLKRRAGGDAALLNIDDLFAAILVARGLVESGVATAGAFAEGRSEALVARKRQVRRDNDPDRSLFERKTQPLPLAPVSDRGASLRLNMFLPELQLGTFFGGYHSKISLISRLAARGVRTRLVLVDQPSVDFEGVSRIVGAFPELEAGLMTTEILACGSRGAPLPLGPRDALLATTWWSAHIVEAARRDLDRRRFLYFIQEFEPFTFELGTNYRAAEMTYDFPHDAVFSTELLQDYFAHTRAGVFGPRALADAEALAFRNPITGLKDVHRRPRAARKPRLLFYARPQAHAGRNMYEFGVAALRQAAETLGSELDGWELIGVGASEAASVKLGGERRLKLMSKLDAAGYRDMLASSDVGLALMYTPHPSLVPLEMAGAGLLTVTNACMTKTKAAFAGVSDLIDVAEPDVGDIARALIAAVRRVNAGPVPNVPIDWPTSPAEAFPDAWLDRFVALAERSLGRR
ncbi:MAG: hypothetical protein ACK4Z5_01240 [Brevundimonas sp.]